MSPYMATWASKAFNYSFQQVIPQLLKHIDFDCQKIASKRNQKASMSYLS